jgi:RHS repeat-associated protein
MTADQAATSLLYSGEFTDAATGQQYLRARFYDPSTGRFNRLDDFAGDPESPGSLHKYVYATNDPVQFIDPTGLFFSAVGSVNVAGISAAGFAQSLGASLLVLNSVNNLLNLHPEHNRLARNLDTEVISRKDVETERRNNPGKRYFAHGSSSGAWSGSEIDPTRGNPNFDFGLGFYTFEATPQGLRRASQQAINRTTGTPPNGGGIGFVLVVRISDGAFNGLRQKSYGTRYAPSSDYAKDVNAFRSGTRQPPLTGSDVAFGPVAHRATSGPWTWVANPSYPEQYKFETAFGTRQLEPVGIIPVFSTYLA